MQEEEIYRLWLYDALHAGNARMAELLALYPSAKELFLRARGGGLADAPAYAAKLLPKAAQEARIEALLKRCERAGARVLSRLSPQYPPLLAQIYDPPEILFVRGTLPAADVLPLAVIGARKCTQYGREMAKRFAMELAQAGLCIVSGLASGADMAASEGALESGSARAGMAVLGCGIDVVYPREAAALYEKLAGRGALLSEFLPGMQPLRNHFPRRNRVISGLSRGVLVVEAGARSGTSITVDFALEQGRDVFALPGRITDPMSAGTNRYIRDGYAKAVLSTEDVLCEYGLPIKAKGAAKTPAADMSAEEALLYGLLQSGEKNFDELCVLSGYAPNKLNSVLTVMEFSGIIRQVSGRMYSL